MLDDATLRRVDEEAEQRWPHLKGGDPYTNTSRAVRRLTFRQGVEYAIEQGLALLPLVPWAATQHGDPQSHDSGDPS
ncbi:hypothetical protein IT072_02520 [Leifsonia sp. ZF2019]|uniref:hypothetical protein n=1 Tax=Leifsonia sp. ZF2019 TaxID=2781978 RepID=UPI001CBE1B14|nr:hypothetical protein [Leifsonia sp. ZF2019]UAJ79972.1 hypothetical protein IT072_02520 [Leifsonia sp. ZF2019]